MNTGIGFDADRAKAFDRAGSRGSALLAAVLVMALLCGMGLILHFVSQTEMKMSSADVRAKQAFYLAESGTERGREALRAALDAAGDHDLVPRIAAAAGPDGDIDFNPAAVQPIFSGTTLTGFTGTGDDVPILALTTLDGGRYAAYLTNDPADGEGNLADTNDQIMLTGLGVGADGAFEMAQLVVTPGSVFPSIPATITLLGPNPDVNDKGGKGWKGSECKTGSTFKGSKIYVDGLLVKSSKVYRAYNGTDCAPYRRLNGVGPDGQHLQLANVPGSGDNGLFMPVYGAVDGASETRVENDLKGSKLDYLSDMYVTTQYVRPAAPVGNYQGDDTVANLSDATEPTVIGSGLGPLDPFWTNCMQVRDLVEKLRGKASYVCGGGVACNLPATTPASITFIDGDFRLPCNGEGWGTLVVTGKLDFPNNASWHGLVFVVGQGVFYRITKGTGTKTGYGNTTGATVVADIAGPDNLYGTADDCTGGTGGFNSVVFDEGKSKAYRGNTIYCTNDIEASNPGFRFPARRVTFRQR